MIVCVFVCCVPVRACVRVRVCVCARASPAHLEADVLQMPVEVVQHSASVEQEGGLQHLLVDLFIVQFLWRDDGALINHAVAR